jgi:hypothetical protein
MTIAPEEQPPDILLQERQRKAVLGAVAISELCEVFTAEEFSHIDTYQRQAASNLGRLFVNPLPIGFERIHGNADDIDRLKSNRHLYDKDTENLISQDPVIGVIKPFIESLIEHQKNRGVRIPRDHLDALRLRRTVVAGLAYWQQKRSPKQ